MIAIFSGGLTNTLNNFETGNSRAINQPRSCDMMHNSDGSIILIIQQNLQISSSHYCVSNI